MEGLERLEKEMEEMKNSHIEVIWNYLKTRKDLYDKFNNPEKSIKQMYEFVYEKARKQKTGNVAMIADNVVYLWAVTYFNKSNEELEINKKKEIPKTAETKPKTKKEEKKETKKENKTEQEEKDITKTEDNQTSLFQEVK